MEELVDLQVRRADDRVKVGHVDTALLEPPDASEQARKKLRRVCVHAVAAAAQRKVADNPAHMPWLNEYVVELRRHRNGELMYTFRELGGA